MTWRPASAITLLAIAACSVGAPAGTPATERASLDPVDPSCAWPSAPVVVARHGDAVLEQWELPSPDLVDRAVIPDDAGYLAFRAAIRDAGADRRSPFADRPPTTTEEERELWRREDRNAELVQRGQVGRLRQIHCLEALAFAHQHARYSELTHPTEFIVSVLRRRDRADRRVRVMFSAGSEMFPPRQLYGWDRIERAIGDGWELWFVLHNHTVQTYRGRPALGQPTLSTSDVHLMRNLAPDLGLRQARVTNGMYTVDIDARELDRMSARE